MLNVTDNKFSINLLQGFRGIHNTGQNTRIIYIIDVATFLRHRK